MSISLGVHTGQQNLPMDDLRSVWRKMDQGGMDWISVWDHLYEAPPANGTIDHFEAIACLGALCAETSRARIGVLVFYIGYRNPTLLAKAATTLDHISGGRFELGIGAGWHQQEAEAYGYPFPSLDERFAMLEEAFPLIRSLLTQERTDHKGRFYAAEDCSNLPAPVGGRRLPIWMGGRGPKRTPRIAATFADGWNAAYVSPVDYAQLNSSLDAACDKIGRDPATLERSVNLAFALGADKAASDAALARLTEEWGPRADQIKAGAVLGTPDQAVEQIARYVEAGAQGVNIALRAPWDAEALDAYMEVVMPQLRREFGAA